MTSQYGQHRIYTSSTVVSEIVAVEMCLPHRRVATVASRTTENTIPLQLYHCRLQLLHSNGSTCYIIWIKFENYHFYLIRMMWTGFVCLRKGTKGELLLL